MNAPNHPRIAIDPEICGGQPTIAGTRMRVEDVLDALADGTSEAEILTDFPYLTAADIRACLAFAATLAKAAGRPAGEEAPARRIPSGSYTLETLPPLSEGAKAILASVDAATSSSAARRKAAGRHPNGPPGITLEDEGTPGISLADEGLPGVDPGN
ncbi:MAG TPA: DUF433 domain-containing protein [Allosphingosinicella sp.]|jgi:uncharacterized protein (DUF433 family)